MPSTFFVTRPCPIPSAIESPSFVSRLPLVNQDHIAAPYGSAQTILIFGFCSLRYVLTPASVPPVPTAATNAVTLPSVCFQISAPVLRYSPTPLPSLSTCFPHTR